MDLGLANTFLEKCLEKKSSLFVGMNSLFDRQHTTRFCTVINTDGHFVGLVGTSNYLFYYDPFGLPPTDTEIVEFSRLDPRPLFYNHTTHQHPDSIFCGFFVLLFLLLCEYIVPVFIPFQKNLKLNDDICITNLKNLLRHNKRANS